LQIPGMLRTTLGAFHAAHPGMPIKALRLRIFAGYPQGIVIGGGDDTTQWAYDATTGGTAYLWQPGYPKTGQTWGWENDQVFKSVHRGDAFGIPGRLMSLFAGLSLLFLTISGGWMYLDMWKRRRKAGRHGLFWS
jgi:hypothetical protein